MTTMKVAGRFALQQLEQDDPSMSGSIRALLVELEAARYRSDADVQEAYPNATVAAQTVDIPLDTSRCAVVVFNYPQEIALIEYAGPRSKRPRDTSQAGRTRS